MSSHAAALRAVAAGYKDVAVMGDGIMGWIASQQPVDHVSESASDGKSS